MAKLLYSMLTSVDGFVADEKGEFDWAFPPEELHVHFNDLQRTIGTNLYGRRMYEVMTAWETLHTVPDMPDYILEFAAIWQASDKVVYSRTLETVSTQRTTLERTFDLDAIRKLKAESELDISISGPHLAAEALRAGLIDECQFFLAPMIIGRGNPALPADLRTPVELIDERRFGSGWVMLHYRMLPME